MPSLSPRMDWPEIPSSPALPYRDVVLIDLARHAARSAPFDLGTIQADTQALWDALKQKADEVGVPPEGDPEPILDELEPFALSWARDRVARYAAGEGA